MTNFLKKFAKFSKISKLAKGRSRDEFKPVKVPAWERNSEYLHVYGRYPSLLPDPYGYGYLAIDADQRSEFFTEKVLEDYRKSEPAVTAEELDDYRKAHLPAELTLINLNDNRSSETVIHHSCSCCSPEEYRIQLAEYLNADYLGTRSKEHQRSEVEYQGAEDGERPALADYFLGVEYHEDSAVEFPEAEDDKSQIPAGEHPEPAHELDEDSESEFPGPEEPDAGGEQYHPLLIPEFQKLVIQYSGKPPPEYFAAVLALLDKSKLEKSQTKLEYQLATGLYEEAEIEYQDYLEATRIEYENHLEVLAERKRGSFCYGCSFCYSCSNCIRFCPYCRLAGIETCFDKPLCDTCIEYHELKMPPMPQMSYSRGKSPRQQTESDGLNQVVITDPSEDIAREGARLAEAKPMQSIRSEDRATSNGGTDSPRSVSKRQDFSNEKISKREIRIGDYILGQTLGEGEFGKVKMGWKKEGGVQVAIKLIRREKLDNKARLDKVYREISILRDLDHPNIVRLHEMVETERTIGIILEYASGGELFDYILHERFLKDHAARRLFAQLVSGVGYLHKKGIIHRDLKLENLLLDRNRNIIITDFGFANTFDPNDELGEKIISNLHDRSFVKRYDLHRVQENGCRRGDLMSTSCGSPCYAAPELVVSDGLYTGRKVDVWSCGVILYAMLSGYLPFDDDPANPDGDNINLLYKYIVTAPLVFPEHVTPHARDILRRILVPDPRQRADLFEVARHSWLNDYAHVVEFITSGTTSPSDVAKATVSSDGQYGLSPSLARSASVREATKASNAPSPVGGLMSKHGKVNIAPDTERKPTPKDQKRRTVQIEYVAPQSQTTRGDSRDTAAEHNTAIKSQSPNTKLRTDGPSTSSIPRKPAPSSAKNMLPPSRPGRDVPRSVSDSTAFTMSPTPATARPPTSGSMTPSSRLPQRGSYGQPSAATVATTIAQGRFSQPPPPSRNKRESTPVPAAEAEPVVQPVTSRNVTNEIEERQQKRESMTLPEPNQKPKRNSALSNLGEKLFGRSNSKSSRRAAEQQQHSKAQEEQLWQPGFTRQWALTHEQADAPAIKNRAFPPSSMRPVNVPDSAPRKSTESKRSFGFSRKSFESSNKEKRNSKRFSLIPRLSSGSRPATTEAADTLRPELSRGQDGSEDIIPRVRYEPRIRPTANDYVQPNGTEYTTLPPVETNPEWNNNLSATYNNREASGTYSNRDASGTYTNNTRLVSNVASHAQSTGDQIPFETPWPVYTPQQMEAVEDYRMTGRRVYIPQSREEKEFRERNAREDAEMRRKSEERKRKEQERKRKEEARQSKIMQPPATEDQNKNLRTKKSSTTSKVMGFFRGRRQSQVA